MAADSSLEEGTAKARAEALGAETAIDPIVYPVPQGIDDMAPRVIHDGTNYFVVWLGAGNSGVYGARVSQSGMPIDPISIRLVPADFGATSLDVAFNGSVYLIVWTDPGQHIYCVRVSTAGEVLDSKPIEIGGTLAFDPAVASDGSNFLVVWSDQVGGAQGIWGARVDTNGVVLDPGGVSFGAEATSGRDPDTSFDGTGYLVVFTRGEEAVDVFGLRVSGAASPIGSEFRISSPMTGNEQEPGIAYAPELGTHLVVWRLGGVVYGRRVRSDGLVLGAAEAQISPANDGSWPQVTYGAASTGWLVTWNRSSDVMAARVDPQGVTVGSALVSSGNVGMPAVASSGAGSLVAWHQGNPGYDVFAKRVSLQGTVQDSQPRLISKTNNRQTAAAAAFDGTNNLVVWLDDRNGSDVRGARVNAQGEVLDVSPIVLTNTAEPEAEPDIAYNGSEYLVVWTRSAGAAAEILGSRVSPAGAVMDPAGIQLSGAGMQGAPTVAALGSEFLVAWTAQGIQSEDILGKRVAADGTVLDAAPIGIAVGPNSQTQPSVSSDGKDYLVVWRELGSNSDIRGARVSPAGTVLDPAGLGIAVHLSQNEAEPDVAFGGAEYLVVWRMTTLDKIYGIRVSTGGETIGDAFPLSGEAAMRPAVIHDGYKFFVAWQLSEHGRPYHILGARIDDSYVVPDRFTPYRGGDSDVALSPRGAGKVLIAYQKRYDTATMRGPRVFFNTLDLRLAGASCASAIECATGLCVDGVCCLTACVGNCSSCAPGTGQCSPNDSLCTGSCERCESADGGFSCIGDDAACPGQCDACDSGLQDQGEEPGPDVPGEADAAEADAGDAGESAGDADAEPVGRDSDDEDSGTPEESVESGAEAEVIDSALESGPEAGALEAAVEAGAADAVKESGPEVGEADEGLPEQRACACRAAGQSRRPAERVAWGIVGLLVVGLRRKGRIMRSGARS